MKTIKQLSEARSDFAKVGFEIKEQEKLWFDFWKNPKNRKKFKKQIEEHLKYEEEEHYKRNSDQFYPPEEMDDVEVSDDKTGIAYNAALRGDNEVFDDVYLGAYGYGNGKNKDVGISYYKGPADKVEERQMTYSTTKSKVLKNIMKQIIKMGNEAISDIGEYDSDDDYPMSNSEFARMVLPSSAFSRR